MRFLQRINVVRKDDRFVLSLLVFATGLVLTLQNPLAQDSLSRLASSVEMPNFEHVFEMRPQTPPPAMEGDQLMADEGEEVQTLVTTEREYSRDTDLRAAPQR